MVHDARWYSVLDTVMTSGEDVCFSVVFGTLIGVLSSVMWSELLMTSAISCHHCTSARELSVRSHLRCGMFMLYAVLHVHVCCFVVRVVVFSVVNVYHHHLKSCVY